MTVKTKTKEKAFGMKDILASELFTSREAVKAEAGSFLLSCDNGMNQSQANSKPQTTEFKARKEWESGPDYPFRVENMVIEIRNKAEIGQEPG
jgi:hypothetical protein